MAMRFHPFPFRTRKLSSFASKILGWRRPGKIDRCRHLRYSSIAQSVEHLTVNQGVTGSSPVGGASKKHLPNGRCFFIVIRRMQLKSTAIARRGWYLETIYLHEYPVWMRRVYFCSIKCAALKSGRLQKRLMLCAPAFCVICDQPPSFALYSSTTVSTTELHCERISAHVSGVFS